jgi:hypothetical protein
MILRGNSDDLGRTGRGLLVNKGFGFCRIFGPAVFVFLRSPMRRRELIGYTEDRLSKRGNTGFLLSQNRV